MSKAHLTNEEFIAHLGRLFEARNSGGHGSVFLSQKCLSHESLVASTDTNAPGSAIDVRTQAVLIRATDGKAGFHNEKKGLRIKLSTIVDSGALEPFFLKYAEVCKSGMAALKKRDRSKRKEKLKAKKKKGNVL